MINCYLKKGKFCCICHEDKKNYVKCTKCKNSHVCSECLLGLIEHGLVNKCPLCKQENWKNSNISSNTVIPIDNIVEEKIYTDIDRNIVIPKAYQIKRKIKIFFGYLLYLSFVLFISFSVGIITVSMVLTDFEMRDFIIIPTIIGFFESFLILSCCSCCHRKEKVFKMCFLFPLNFIN